MSRGGLMLRQAEDREELEYIPAEGAVLHGTKPPKLAPRRYPRPPVQQVKENTLMPTPRKKAAPPISIPRDRNEVVLDIAGRRVKLTNLGKPFWPKLGITKGDLSGTTWRSRRSSSPTWSIGPW